MTRTSVARVRNWQAALVLWSNGLIGRAFSWGETDCGSLLTGAWEALYGSPEPSPSYSSERGAIRAVKELGAVSAALEERGCTEYPIRYARPGDVLLLELDGQLPEMRVVLPGGRMLVSEHSTPVATALIDYGSLEAAGFRCWRMP